MESVRRAVDGTEWFEPEGGGSFAAFGIEQRIVSLCPEDWARSGRSISAQIVGDGEGGSVLRLTYSVGQNEYLCDSQMIDRRQSGEPPSVLYELQQLRPEGAEADFRIGVGFSSSSDGTSSFTTGFRFEGEASTVARFYARELESRGATVGQVLGDASSAAVQVELPVDGDGGTGEGAPSSGWLLVTRFEDREQPGAPVMMVNVTVMTLDGARSGFSTGASVPLQ
ncbi:MAG: hypothetical protein R3C39_14045 [Dehalococcoidia bacterium]